MLAPTPPMGWNSWNTFGAHIDETLILQTADVLLETGLAEAGYRYVVIDDLWEGKERDAQGRLTADPHKFPSGIAALAERIHAKGLKFGIYSCAGTHTCADQLASYGHEETDARTFADWGVDFLKYDFCNVPHGAHGPTLYRRMGQALRQTGRDILFSACEWGVNKPWLWGRWAGCHMWRTTGDIVDNWDSIKDIGFRRQAGLELYAGPNGWNDPDMMVVGMYGKGNVGAGGCSDSEYLCHFALWCLLASPLMIGCDVRAMNDATLSLLANPGLLRISQDSLGVQARRIAPEKDEWDWSDFPVFAKPLADGTIAVGLFNLSDGDGCNRMGVAWETLGLDTHRACLVSDAISGETIGEFRGSYSERVPKHDARVLLLTPVLG
ncbi:MAG: glycoside hydrolase family 27 protein [Fimbriimonadaceae bacterium]|nr:glycoside hydrolase family 27 protein [Fimbriimonadaceae bacterium]